MREYAKHGNVAAMVETVTLMISGVAQRAEAEGTRDVALMARDAEVALYALLDAIVWTDVRPLGQFDDKDEGSIRG